VEPHRGRTRARLGADRAVTSANHGRDAIAGVLPPAGVARLLIIVLGGMLTLQSSQGLDPPKLAYLAVASIVFLFSCRSVWSMRDRPMFKAAMPWLVSSLVLSALVALSLPVALSRGTPISEWLRDAATYGLFAAAPLFALDAAASMRGRLLLGLTVGIAALGAVSFAIYWITARNLTTLPFEQFVLPTASLPTALFVTSLAAAVVDRRRRLMWIAIGGLALGTFLLTGSRSALLYVVACPVVMVMAGRQLLARSTLASAGTLLIAAGLVAILQASLAPTGQATPTSDVTARATASASATTDATATATAPESRTPSPTASPLPTPTPPPLNPDATLLARLQAFLGSPGQDPSIRERVVQYEAAWEVFASSPLIGAGLGHPFEWTRVDGTTRRDFTADTPLVLPAKLGILGIVWLIGFVAVWMRFLRVLNRTAGLTIPGLAMAAWLGILAVVAWGPLSFEDKGFSFALMLLLSLAFIQFEMRPGRRTLGAAQPSGTGATQTDA